MKSPPSGRLSSLAQGVPQLLIWSGVAATTALFVAGANRGFDFTDEGFYYLSFVHPENVSDNHTSFFFFGGKIFAFLGGNIVAMRVCTLLACLGSALIFLSGVRVFLQRFHGEVFTTEHFHLLGGALLSTCFLGFAISPASLSYNFQNAVCLLAAGGCLLHASALPRSERWFDRASVAALALFGMIIGLEFFVKFSSSLILLAVGTVFFALVGRQSPKQKAGVALCLVSNLGLVAAAYFGFLQDFGQWKERISGLVWSLTSGTSYLDSYLVRYRKELGDIFSMTLENFIPIWVVAVPTVVVVTALRTKLRWQIVAAVIGGGWIVIHLIWVAARIQHFIEPGLPFFLGVLLLLLLLGIGSWFAGRARNISLAMSWPIAALSGFCLVLPLIGSFGTTNEIYANSLYQLAPWFVLATILLTLLDRAWDTKWISRIALVILTGVVVNQFYHGYWHAPYRINGSRSLQTIPTAVGEPATSLRLDFQTNEFIVTGRETLRQHGFKPGDDLLVFFNLPGFVFAMGGQSPGHPWYFQGSRKLLEDDLRRLRSIDPARLRRAFIVRNDATEEHLTLLREAGLNFPDDYRRLTPPIDAPFTGMPFEIWQPK